MNKKFLLKKLKKWKRSLLTYLKKRNCQKLSEVFWFCSTSSTMSLRNAVKNAWNGVAAAMGFIQVGNYSYFNSIYFIFSSVLFINPLIPVPGIPNLYPQYHLILSFTIQRQPFVDFMNDQCEFHSIALDESTNIIQPNFQFLLEVLQIILKLVKSYWKCAQ